MAKKNKLIIDTGVQKVTHLFSGIRWKYERKYRWTGGGRRILTKNYELDYQDIHKVHEKLAEYLKPIMLENPGEFFEFKRGGIRFKSVAILKNTLRDLHSSVDDYFTAKIKKIGGKEFESVTFASFAQDIKGNILDDDLTATEKDLIKSVVKKPTEFYNVRDFFDDVGIEKYSLIAGSRCVENNEISKVIMACYLPVVGAGAVVFKNKKTEKIEAYFIDNQTYYGTAKIYPAGESDEAVTMIALLKNKDYHQVYHDRLGAVKGVYVPLLGRGMIKLDKNKIVVFQSGHFITEGIPDDESEVSLQYEVNPLIVEGPNKDSEPDEKFEEYNRFATNIESYGEAIYREDGELSAKYEMEAVTKKLCRKKEDDDD